MVIVELKDRIPTVTGMAQSGHNYMVKEHLGTQQVIVVEYKGSPVWCREEEAEEIKSYWDGKYLPPEKVFT